MKKCPSCDAINQDYDYDCGVCGSSLSGIVSKNLKILEAETPAKARPKSRLNPGGLAVFAAGLATISVGLYLFFASGPIGLLLLLVGVPILAYVFGITGSTFGVPGQGAASSKSVGRQGKVDTVRRTLEEDLALESQKKGEKVEDTQAPPRNEVPPTNEK